MAVNLSIRIRVLLFLGLALICLALFYVRYFIDRPIGKGPAGPAVSSADFQSTWTDREVLVLGVGDSITAGLGARSIDHSYFNRLIQNPVDDFDDMQGVCLTAVLPNLRRLNLAVSGSTSADHLVAIEERLEPQPENVFGLVLMTSGGNDLIHSYGRMPPKECAMYGASLSQAKPWIENYKLRLEKILDGIRQSFPGGCEIFLADIYDPTDGVGDAPSVYLPAWPDGLAIHAEYNKTIRFIADRYDDVHLVPLHETFLGHGSHCRQFWREHYDRDDPHYWFYTNIEDPNDRGYDAIRRIFLNEIVANSKLRQGSTEVRR